MPGHEIHPSVTISDSFSQHLDTQSFNANGATKISKPAHFRNGSIGQKEAESHVPTLKGVSRSDCEVKIISIAECETDLDLVYLSAKDKLWGSENMQTVLAHARSPSPNPSEISLGIIGSRASQAQKALRRPMLPTREGWPQRRPSYFSLLESAESYVNKATIRRLTSSMWAVRKQAFSGAKQDGNRLLKQIVKQIEFSAWCRTDHLQSVISTPEIYGIRSPHIPEEQDTLVVDMEYIPFHDTTTVLLEKDKSTWDWFIDTAIGLVDNMLTKTKNVPLHTIMPQFNAKARNIRMALHSSELLTDFDIEIIDLQFEFVLGYYTNCLSDAEVPLGTCHGDLTLLNILADTDNREFCVLDFLDCFVESPLQDIAKLLQDVRHHWFFTVAQISPDQLARGVTFLALFHEKIIIAYQKYSFWDVLPLFEFFCVARILPYMTTIEEKRCLMAGLQRVVKKSPVDLDRPYHETGSGITVILPALGPDMDEVYPDGAVKLLTTNSNGRPLIVDCISNLDVRNVSRIVVIVLRSTIEEHCVDDGSFESLFDLLGPRKCGLLEFYYAEEQTVDVVETITDAITTKDIQGPIFIKDADNDFAHVVSGGNYITVSRIVKDDTSNELSKSALRPDLVDAMRKSYVSFSYDNLVSNIAYGSFLSSDFCCGGWSFLEASDFSSAASKLRRLLRSRDFSCERKDSRPRNNELRVVDILWELTCESHPFFGVRVSQYKDWGSIAAWKAAYNYGDHS
ncbi:hypothetical protein M501DRAFT_992192 [Patellaria atrata CBS 101060]|uniref:Aminoglycoside phosphotransferase domain-containing protein n=1 Tax=Patellaria atrata CBS 101060 TaxID=1346257 RepID=A0A9P4VRB6_9PEZI|nr:hypothetical protein M501DRAFT_992192 [Patellaria atrata CBS 101060]